MIFVKFNIIFVALLLTVHQEEIVEFSDVLFDCINDKKFVEWVNKYPIEQNCDQLIIVENKYVSNADGLIFNNKPVDFWTEEEVLMDPSSKTVLLIMKIEAVESKHQTLMLLDLKLFKFTLNDENTSTTGMVMCFQVNMIPDQNNWKIKNIDEINC